MNLTKLEKTLSLGQGGVKELLAIFNSLSLNQGRLDGLEDGLITGSDEEIGKNFCTRLAAAFCQVLSSQEPISIKELEQLMVLRNYIDLVFGLSSFYNSDHILNLIPDGEMVRTLTALTVQSKSKMDFDEAYKLSKEATVLALLQFCTSRFILSKKAFELKERALKWLPTHLDEVKLGYGMLSKVAEVYMHCSYASFEEKHEIKAPLLRQLKRVCLEFDCKELDEAEVYIHPEKPNLVVISEQFQRTHVTWRTHSKAIRSLKEKFNLIGVNFPADYTNEDQLYDDIIPAPHTLELFQQVKVVSDEILKRKPVAIFFLGVGMCPQSIALASLRLAPLQFTSFGHTASTFSKEMDYFILPREFVKEEKVFSEKVIKLPFEAFPLTEFKCEVKAKDKSNRIKIAVSASAMKLNPVFLDSVKRIMNEVGDKAEIHFFPFASKGLIYLQMKELIEKSIKNSTLWPEMPHEEYISELSSCDFLISPFPYGNMNSIIDGFSLGLPSVCLDGDEPHSHADSAFIKRVGLPESFVTKSIKEYEHNIRELVYNPRILQFQKDRLREADLQKLFFTGDEKLFCDAVLYLTNKHAKTEPQNNKWSKLG